MLDLKHFRDIFKPLPGNHYLEVTTKTDEITKLFSDMMQSVGGEFNLALYGTNEQNLDAITAKTQLHRRTWNAQTQKFKEQHNEIREQQKTNETTKKSLNNVLKRNP